MPADRITPEELHARLKGDARPPALLDVREAWEVDIAAMPGALWIPLDELPARVKEVPWDRDVVCVCHHGVRSAVAARFLADAGHPGAYNLVGGVDRWSREADPSFPRY